jgi:hypothetical protein
MFSELEQSGKEGVRMDSDCACNGRATGARIAHDRMSHDHLPNRGRAAVADWAFVDLLHISWTPKLAYSIR